MGSLFSQFSPGCWCVPLFRSVVSIVCCKIYMLVMDYFSLSWIPAPCYLQSKDSGQLPVCGFQLRPYSSEFSTVSMDWRSTDWVVSTSFFILYWSVYISESQEMTPPSPRGIWHCLETFLKVMTTCPVGRGRYTSYNAQDSPTTGTYMTSKTSVVQRWRNSGLNMYFYSGHILYFLIREKSYLLLLKKISLLFSKSSNS